MTTLLRGIQAIVTLYLKRAWLDRARVVAGVIQPLLYLFVLGSGLGASSRMAGAYRPFILPGILGLNLLMTATFAAIAIVFDRQIGFFKAVLVAPIPRASIAIGKIVSGAFQALLQAMLLLPFAPLIGVRTSAVGFGLFLVAMALSALVFSALSVALASRFTSTTVFPIVNNAFVLPMFFLSGAMYPLDAAPAWMQVAARFDPVAYAVDLMRGTLLDTGFHYPAWMSVGILLALVGILTADAVRVFSRGEDDSSLGASQHRWRR